MGPHGATVQTPADRDPHPRGPYGAVAIIAPAQCGRGFPPGAVRYSGSDLRTACVRTNTPDIDPGATWAADARGTRPDRRRRRRRSRAAGETADALGTRPDRRRRSRVSYGPDCHETLVRGRCGGAIAGSGAQEWRGARATR